MLQWTVLVALVLIFPLKLRLVEHHKHSLLGRNGFVGKQLFVKQICKKYFYVVIKPAVEADELDRLLLPMKGTLHEARTYSEGKDAEHFSKHERHRFGSFQIPEERRVAATASTTETEFWGES